MAYQWPSEVKDDGEPPALVDLIAAGGQIAAHAGILLKHVKAGAERGESFRMQEIFGSPIHGPVCVPAMGSGKDGTAFLVYSHSGRWSNEDLEALSNWIMVVRTVPALRDVEVRLVCDVASTTATDACAKVHGPMLALLGRFGDDPTANAELVGKEIFGSERPELADLEVLDKRLLESQTNFAELPLLMRAYTQGYGSYFGELLVREFGMSWALDGRTLERNGAAVMAPFEKTEAFLSDLSEAKALSQLVDLLQQARTMEVGGEAGAASTAAAASDDGIDVALQVYQTILDQRERERRRRENVDDRSVKIEVDASVGRLPLMYEKLRNALDYQDRNLVFRNAVRRVLGRMVAARELSERAQTIVAGQSTWQAKVKSWQKAFAGQHKEPDKMAVGLVVELIRAGYLDNGRVPEAKAEELAAIIERYLLFREAVLQRQEMDAAGYYESEQWLVELMATEVAESLSNDPEDYLKQRALGEEWSTQTGQLVVGHLCRLVGDNIQDRGDNSEFTRDKELQIYLSVYKRLFKYSDKMNTYTVLRCLVPEWSSCSREKLLELADGYPALRGEIDRQLHHPFGLKVSRLTDRYAVYFTFLRKALEEDPEACMAEIKDSYARFQCRVVEVCDRAYKESRKWLHADVGKCVLYVLLSKLVLILALEHPVTALFYPNMPWNVEMFGLGVNLAFPLLYLVAIGLFTGVPGRRNTKDVLRGLDEVLLGKRIDTKLVKLEYEVVSFRFMKVYYGVLLGLAYVLVAMVAQAIGLTVVGTAIFLFFFTMISFLGVTLRRIARAYQAVPAKPSLLGFLGGQFYLPIVAIGKWVSELIADNNIFLIVMDHFIEGSFKKMVDRIERWTGHMKDLNDDAMA